MAIGSPICIGFIYILVIYQSVVLLSSESHAIAQMWMHCYYPSGKTEWLLFYLEMQCWRLGIRVFVGCKLRRYVNVLQKTALSSTSLCNVHNCDSQ
jgi:hypothetical protein